MSGGRIPFQGPILRVGVVGREHAPMLASVLDRLGEWAAGAGVELSVESAMRARGALPSNGAGGGVAVEECFAELDLLLTLGGDGTLLRGARMVAPFGVPVLGLNLGRLGFLTAMGAEELETRMGEVVAGEAFLDSRFTVEAAVVREDGSVAGRLWALNDMVLNRGGVARVARLDLFVGEGEGQEEVGSFSGDGLIVATPTGSTAYSLSAGGPVIEPSMQCLVATPISPHTMAMRPLVLPADERLTIRTVDRLGDMVITADGQEILKVGPTDEVQVEKGRVNALLVRFPGQTFFTTLRNKLNWAV